MSRRGTIALDGRLDEPAWAEAAPATDFRQQQPDEGVPATQRTELRILFDADALYIGAGMFDSLGANGVRHRLTRRDREADSDWIEIHFDTHHDHLRYTIFAVNPLGVRYDARHAGGATDASWDPVWEVTTTIDSLGWTAEFRIPLSQLRFSGDSIQTWGMQVWRTVSRLNEVSMWSYWARSETGGPQRFGHVDGLEVRRGARRLEMLPYMVGRAQFLRPDAAGNPLRERRQQDARIGTDLTYRLTSALTVDATINPDFGQMELDPAVVNLTAFETAFGERRPFFVAGNDIFGFGSFGCLFCSNVSPMSLFYSRRIGREPQGELPNGTEYEDRPDATTILGATKLTGRTGNGVTLGVLDAITDRERAPLVVNGVRLTRELEPRTNYFVGRLQKDFAQGNLELGTIVTSTARFTDDSLLDAQLPARAEALGFDWSAWWRSRTYSFRGNVALSTVHGEASAIDRLQRASARYLHRPDRAHGENGLFSDRYDPAATHLRGFGGYARLGKTSGAWLWESSVNFRSPGFEVNDLAFLTRADYVWMNANVSRQWTKPGRWYRTLQFIGGTQQQYNFDGDVTDRQFHGYARATFLNYWQADIFALRRPEVDDDRLLRGGPVVRRVGNWAFAANINTDRRQPLVVGVNPYLFASDEGYDDWDLQFDIQVKPAPNVELVVAPYVGRNHSARQYVQAVADSTASAFFGRRYILSDLEQKNVGFDTRLNVAVTPALTLELFVQPFISSVRYSRFKEIAAPRSIEMVTFGEDTGTVVPVRDPAGRVVRYDIDPDGAGPAARIEVANPDFVFRSLRGNLVLRWEYRPGSTVFFAWTRQGSSRAAYLDNFDFGRDVNELLGANADNVFMVKMTYWLNR